MYKQICFNVFKNFRFSLTVLLGILFLNAYPQGLFESTAMQGDDNDKLELGGYARGSFFGFTEDYDYSTVFGEFCLQGEMSSNKAYVYSDIRFYSGYKFGAGFTGINLKEAYAAYRGDRFSVFAGNQIMAWGRADGFNPTNNITPNDYFLLTSDVDDQKMSNFLLRAKVNFTTEIDLELIGIPLFKPSVYRYDLFAMGGDATFLDPKMPNADFKNTGYAARLNFELPKAGFSLSWFKGCDPFYGFDIESVEISQELSPSLYYIPKFYEKNTIGADFAIPVDSWILRGEAAYDITQGYKENMHVPNPGLYYVAGLEHDFWGFLAIAQYIGKYTFDFEEIPIPALPTSNDPQQFLAYVQAMIVYESTAYNRKVFNQQEKTNHAALFTVNKSFAYEALRAELSFYRNFTTEEMLLRPAISWNITDALSASVGASIMRGPEGSLFDLSSNVLSGGFAALKVSF